jgi:hypothetical protein
VSRIDIPAIDDVDNDGDLDLFLTGIGTTGAKTLLYKSDVKNKRNTAPAIPSGLIAGFNCMIVQMAAGTVTIAQGSGTTVYNRANYNKSGGQYAVVTVVSPAANVFVTGGDMQ